jgi:4-amino-4-deoxy-L-arabinose transferase-like glycosyltransferase
MRCTACPWIAVAIVLAVYLFVSLNHLADFPPMGQDEPWIAAAPYKLATQGVYGSDLFAGYYGMDRHNFDHMPVYPLLQSGVFRLFGVGPFQMRILPLSLGFVVLLLVVAAGYQLGSVYIGVIGAVLLIGLRVAAGDGATGILLLDLARINRYDMAVPVFGLMALLMFNRAEQNDSRWWFALTGLFVGLSSLSHLYGGFWLPVFFIVLLYRRRLHLFRRTAPFFMLAGFLCTWLPWLAYISSNWTDYLNQTRSMADRFEILRPSFYISNILNEVDRYRSIGIQSPSGGLSVARPGAWTVLLGVPAALGLMVWQTRNCPRDAVFTLAGAAIIQAVLFGVLLKAKTYAYLIALWPLGALALAWLAVRLWTTEKASMIARAALLALLALILVEGSMRVTHTWRLAERTTSYSEFTRKVATCIPADSLVLGLQHYWLGLRQFPYRSWLVPVYYTHASYYQDRLTMDAALERVRPDVVLIDRYMNEYFERIKSAEHPDHDLYQGFRTFMDRHNAELRCVVEDETYDKMQVYLLK